MTNSIFITVWFSDKITITCQAHVTGFISYNSRSFVKKLQWSLFGKWENRGTQRFCSSFHSARVVSVGLGWAWRVTELSGLRSVWCWSGMRFGRALAGHVVSFLAPVCSLCGLRELIPITENRMMLRSSFPGYPWHQARGDTRPRRHRTAIY